MGCSEKSPKGSVMKQSQNFELDVYVHGSKAKQYFNEGKFFVEGKEGSTFDVRATNNTGRRVLAVITVDGLSVMDGKDGSFDSNGYIISAWQSIRIPGWRLNNKAVAAFEFTKSGLSYASSKGKGSNGGVIGCAFYYEKLPIIYPEFTVTTTSYPIKTNWQKYNSSWYSDNTGAYPKIHHAFMAQSPFVNQVALRSMDLTKPPVKINTLGTGFGSEVDHKVTKESFDREPGVPSEILTVYYDSREGLELRGIDTRSSLSISSPSPFPKENLDEYCQPPVGWKK